MGEEHPSTQLSLNNVANLQWKLGPLDVAETLFRESLEVQLRTLGRDHPGTVVTLSNLGNLCRDLGRPDEAEEHLRSALEGSTHRQGRSHPDSLRCLGRWMELMETRRRRANAATLARELIALGEGVLPPDDPNLALARATLRRAYPHRRGDPGKTCRVIFRVVAWSLVQ